MRLLNIVLEPAGKPSDVFSRTVISQALSLAIRKLGEEEDYLGKASLRGWR